MSFKITKDGPGVCERPLAEAIESVALSVALLIPRVKDCVDKSLSLASECKLREEINEAAQRHSLASLRASEQAVRDSEAQKASVLFKEYNDGAHAKNIEKLCNECNPLKDELSTLVDKLKLIMWPTRPVPLKEIGADVTSVPLVKANGAVDTWKITLRDLIAILARLQEAKPLALKIRKADGRGRNRLRSKQISDVVNDFVLPQAKALAKADGGRFPSMAKLRAKVGKDLEGRGFKGLQDNIYKKTKQAFQASAN